MPDNLRAYESAPIIIDLQQYYFPSTIIPLPSKPPSIAIFNFSFDVLAVNKPIQVSDGTTTLVVSSSGSHSITFTTTTTSQGINFFHQSNGQPARIELDNLTLEKTEEITEIACTNILDIVMDFKERKMMMK